MLKTGTDTLFETLSQHKFELLSALQPRALNLFEVLHQYGIQSSIELKQSLYMNHHTLLTIQEPDLEAPAGVIERFKNAHSKFELLITDFDKNLKLNFSEISEQEKEDFYDTFRLLYFSSNEAQIVIMRWDDLQHQSVREMLESSPDFDPEAPFTKKLLHALTESIHLGKILRTQIEDFPYFRDYSLENRYTSSKKASSKLILEFA